MYKLKDSTKIIELGGHQIDDNTLETMKKQLNLTENQIELKLQLIADRSVREFIERFE